MKIIAIIVCFLVISISLAYSEEQIPNLIKEDAMQLYSQNNFDENDVRSILTTLSDQKIIKNIPSNQEIYLIPEIGKTDFIKISGKINEYGRTAYIVLEITKPDGTIQKFNSPLLETGQYHTVYPIDWNSQIGTYKIQTMFADEIKSVSFFHLTQTKLPEVMFPPWIITAFEWWIEEKISDSELVYSIEHLGKLGLVSLSEKPSSTLQVKIIGDSFVRRGLTHTINVLVTDGYKPIEGAKVTLTIEDYGEEIIREFEGLTNPNGFFIYSWEVPKSFDDVETLLAFISVSGNGESQTHLWKFKVYCLPGTGNCEVEGN